MIYKKLESIPAFTAGDATKIREWLHPKNDSIDLPYSLAFAELEPGAASLPHILKNQTEVYLVIEGSGMAYVGGQAQAMQQGDLVLIPNDIEQYVENTGDQTLRFICVVSPPWAKEDEVVME